jgi:hypothetical protein
LAGSSVSSGVLREPAGSAPRWSVSARRLGVELGRLDRLAVENPCQQSDPADEVG